MFACRCYELLACGCPVLSNYSYGMSRLLPAVAVMNSVDDVARTMHDSDAESIRLRRAIGIREVMNGNTCYDRIGDVLRAAGFADAQPVRKLAVVVPAVDAKAQRMFAAQTFAEKTLFAEKDFGEADFQRFDYVARWKAESDYGPHYLEDMVNAFKFGDFDFSTESGYGYATTETRPDMEKTVLWRRAFTYQDFVSGRWRHGLTGMTLPQSDLTMRPVGIQAFPQKKAAIWVSVGHDADGLVLRVIPSLRRSSFFGNLKIVLCDVDGGDPATADVVTRTCAMYPGIVQMGGSVKDLPSFLMHASDEALYPGFDNMVEMASGGGAGKVAGDVLLCGQTRRVVEGGAIMSTDGDGAERRLAMPVIARYSESSEVDGRLWTDPPLRKGPLWRRTYGCFQDNGFWYTIRRIFCGPCRDPSNQAL